MQEAGALVGGNVVASLVVLPGEMPQNCTDIAGHWCLCAAASPGISGNDHVETSRHIPACTKQSGSTRRTPVRRGNFQTPIDRGSVGIRVRIRLVNVMKNRT